jgi:hypothetical protein
MEAGLEAKCRALRNITERAEWCAPQFDAAERVDRRIQKEYAAELAKLEQCLAAAVSGIGRVDWKLETMHGKNVCDPLTNMPMRTLKAAIELQHVLLPGNCHSLIWQGYYLIRQDTT